MFTLFIITYELHNCKTKKHCEFPSRLMKKLSQKVFDSEDSMGTGMTKGWNLIPDQLTESTVSCLNAYLSQMSRKFRFTSF